MRNNAKLVDMSPMAAATISAVRPLRDHAFGEVENISSPLISRTGLLSTGCHSDHVVDFSVYRAERTQLSHLFVLSPDTGFERYNFTGTGSFNAIMIGDRQPPCLTYTATSTGQRSYRTTECGCQISGDIPSQGVS